jgi:hypothetical protein
MTPTAREIADRQLVAYNARDLDAFCALFHPDAVIENLTSGVETARGMAAIRALYAKRFSSPDLHCVVHQTMDLGPFAIDHETVQGVPEGAFDAIAIYEVRDGLIVRARMIRQA